MKMYQAKDYPSALAEFRRLAEIGDHGSQFNIGVMYFRGEGVERDPIQAYAWMALATQDQDEQWKRSRDQVYSGLSTTQKESADAARTGLFARLSDEALARQLAPSLSETSADYRPARVIKSVAPAYPREMLRDGKMGFVEASYAVGADGTTRLHGVVNATDVVFAEAAMEALKRSRYEPARLNGNPVEQYGLRIQFVFKLDRNELDEYRIHTTIQRLRAEADKGGPLEAYRYASTLELYSHFMSLPKNADNPNEWFLKAAARGNSAAQFSLGNNLLFGNACTPDAKRGLSWLQSAAEATQPEAQYVLAIEMLSGAHLSQDRTAALKWLERAAASDFKAAKLKLAWLHATSAEESIRNPSMARSYLEKIGSEFIDQRSLFEVQAAVAAASGDFAQAVRRQQSAIDQANKYELPVDALMLELKAYQEGRSWIEPSPSAPDSGAKPS
jgi:uncharacterized protein